jgi:hypothetical protein
MLAEREPWRRNAEMACLKSGAVRESPAVARVAPIDGPGICGADFPLKVAALGESTALGFAGEPPRPPANIPTGSLPRWPINQAPPPAASIAPPRSMPPPSSLPPGAPLDLGSPFDNRPAPAPAARPTEMRPLGPPAPQYTGSVEVKPAATLSCPIVAALDRWMMQSVQPAAQRWFRQPVVEIKQISAYSCRPMNNQRGAKISEHAFGNALDIAAFVLADGRTVKVKDGWRGREQFTTVLAPGADAFHYDHFHVDLMRRADGRRICSPEAVDGEIVAARAQNRAPFAGAPAPAQRNAPIHQRTDPYAWRGAGVKRDDALTTGSLGSGPQPSKAAAAANRDWVEDDGPRPAVR